MSLQHCPECSHEVSENAIACPNCGRPISAVPIVEKKVFVPAPPTDNGFPPWAIVPIGIAVLAVGFLIFLLFRNSDDQAGTNINVNMAGRRTETTVPPTRTTAVPPTESAPVSVPGSQVGVPSVPPPMPATRTDIPGNPTTVTSAPPDKGTVVINAKIAPLRGSPQSARNAKFYLLDKDLETILSEAQVPPIEGNTLSGSLGLAAVFPDRYGDFQRAAMKAIARHIKYSGSTGSSGSASLANIVPSEYYLFAITRVGHGFALWSSPVSVNPGQNVMDLSPQPVTDIPADGGD